MLKEITRAEAVEMMAAEKPVFALFEIDGDMTINDLITADGFVIEVDEEPRNNLAMKLAKLTVKLSEVQAKKQRRADRRSTVRKSLSSMKMGCLTR